MKIKCYVVKSEIVEAEISDKFQQLAQPNPWEDKTLTEEMYEECIQAVENAIGMKFGEHAENGELRDSYIMGVWSAENGETMLED